MQIALALLALATALAPVVVLWLRRRAAPTAEERRDDRARELDDLERQPAEVEARGDLA